MEVNTLRVINQQQVHTDIVCLFPKIRSNQLLSCKNVEPEPDVFMFRMSFSAQTSQECSICGHRLLQDVIWKWDWINSQQLLCFTVPHNRDVDPVWIPAFVSGVFLALLISKPYFTAPPISLLKLNITCRKHTFMAFRHKQQHSEAKPDA